MLAWCYEQDRLARGKLQPVANHVFFGMWFVVDWGAVQFRTVGSMGGGSDEVCGRFDGIPRVGFHVTNPREAVGVIGFSIFIYRPSTRSSNPNTVSITTGGYLALPSDQRNTSPRQNTAQTPEPNTWRTGSACPPN